MHFVSMCLAGRSPVPESQLATPTSMEVLEMGGGVASAEGGVVLSWGQGGGGGSGSASDPLVVSSNDDLEGEDSEVITAFSGQYYMYLYTCMYMYNRSKCHCKVSVHDNYNVSELFLGCQGAYTSGTKVKHCSTLCEHWNIRTGVTL